MKAIFDKYNITGKVVGIVGDNGANMTAMARLLGIKFYSCFAHTLNLVVTNSLQSIKIANLEANATQSSRAGSSGTERGLNFNDLICKCRTLVSTFSYSIILTQQLLDAQVVDVTKGEKKVVLVQDVRTR